MPNEFVQITITCAICGKVRGEANHYYGFVIDQTEAHTIYIRRWDRDLEDSAYVPACGQECVGKLVSRSLEAL